MTDPNLPEQQPGDAVPPPPPPPPPAPDYGAPQTAPAYGQQPPAYGQQAPAYGQPASAYGQPAAAYGPDLPGLLVEQIHSDGVELRVAAARALGSISDLTPEEKATVLSALIPAATDPDERLRTTAAASLQRVLERPR